MAGNKIPSGDVPSHLSEIYSRFRIPPNLQMHMINAAGVASIIADHWKGTQKMIRDDMIAAVLLHDLGNIVKFDLKSHERIRLLGREAERVDFWRRVQSEVTAKYGHDDHQVTLKMAVELGLSKRVMELIDGLGRFSDGKLDVARDSDFELKICSYSDCRVGPYGVMSLDQRFRDLMERYANSPKAVVFEGLSRMIAELQTQVTGDISLAANKIDDQSISSYVTAFAESAGLPTFWSRQGLDRSH
jgi:hypothetical protein